MAQNTDVVEYILKIDAKSAERTLKQIERTTSTTADNVVELGRASKSTSKDIDQMGRETSDATRDFSRMNRTVDMSTRSVQQFGRQANISQKQARNFRRAGRDLDGAFGDLGQGLSLINPAMGGFAIQASNAASIADGFGRTLVAFTNPAFLATAAAIGVVLGAIELYQYTVGETEKRQQELNKQIEFSNDIIRKQQETVRKARSSFDDLTLALQQARTEERLLLGVITDMEAAEFRIRDAVERRATAERKRLDDVEFGLKRERMELEKLAALKDQEDTKGRQVLLGRVQAINQELELLEQQRKALQANTNQLADQLVSNEKLERRQEAAEKRRAKARQQKIKDDQEIARLAKEQEKIIKAVEKAVEMKDKAEFDIRKQILTLRDDEESKIALINLERDRELKRVQDLGHLLDDDNDLIQLQLALYEQAAKAVDKIKFAEEQKNAELQRTLKLQDAIRSGEFVAGGITQVTQLGADPIGAGLSAVSGIGQQLATQSSAVSAQAGPIVMAIVEAIKLAGAIGEMTPEQIEAEAEATTAAIIKGLEMFPTLILDVFPRVFRDFLIELVQVLYKLPYLIIDAVVASVASSIREAFKFFTEPEFRKTFDFNPFPELQELMKNAFDPDVRAFAGGGRLVSAQGGIRFTGSQNGLAMLHQGEFVVPQSGQRPQQVDRALRQQGGNGVVINVNGTLIERNALDELVRRMERRYGSFGQGQTSLFGRA